MSNFLTRIKDLLKPSNINRSGMPRGKVIVDERDLIELVSDFERVDSDMRLYHHFYKDNSDNYTLLRSAIVQMWHRDGKNPENIMYVFTDELRRLTKEKEDNLLNTNYYKKGGFRL